MKGGPLSADVDYEVEYNNRARVPENPAIIAGWSRDAATYREAHPPKVIAYGAGARHRIDLFSGDGAGPIVVFIHGGYWQALDGSFFSHLAAGLNAHGIDVAVPSYDLCPAVSIADIIAEMRAASGSWQNSDDRWSSVAIPRAAILRPACWLPTGVLSMRRCRWIS